MKKGKNAPLIFLILVIINMAWMCSTQLAWGGEVSYAAGLLAEHDNPFLDDKYLGAKHLKKGLSLEVQSERHHGQYENDKNSAALRFLESAQKYYLRASQEGNPLGSFLAARLGESGQVTEIPPETIRQLLTHAAEGGVHDAFYSLAAWYCFNPATECRDLELSFFWLERAAKAGSGGATNSLGALYERGQRGPVDLNRAYSCYEIAKQRGLSIASRNLERMREMLKGNISPVNCY